MGGDRGSRVTRVNLIECSRREHDLGAGAAVAPELERSLQLVPDERAHDRQARATARFVADTPVVVDCEDGVSVSPPPLDPHLVAPVLERVLDQLEHVAIVQGDADVYAHSGGQYEWDSAAPVGVATAAGCHCSRIDGAPLVYNQPDPYLPDLLVCRAELADPVLDAVRAAPNG